ncbi:hypothetical protein V9Z57_01585 [Streptococcus suis]|nr:hypothetical protein [Streptococcus suis]HEM3198434.1 hypothetical protein [Streptococcus suis 14A]
MCHSVILEDDMDGTYPWFDYDRDYLQPEEPRQVHDPDEWVFRGGQWIYVGDA